MQRNCSCAYLVSINLFLSPSRGIDDSLSRKVAESVFDRAVINFSAITGFTAAHCRCLQTYLGSRYRIIYNIVNNCIRSPICEKPPEQSLTLWPPSQARKSVYGYADCSLQQKFKKKCLFYSSCTMFCPVYRTHHLIESGK